MAEPEPATLVRVVTVIVLGCVLIAAVVGITFVAVLTDRDVARAEVLTFLGAVLVGALGGVTWWRVRGRRWHVAVDRNGEDGEPSHGP